MYKKGKKHFVFGWNHNIWAGNKCYRPFMDKFFQNMFKYCNFTQQPSYRDP